MIFEIGSNSRGGSLSIRGIGKRAFNEVQDPSVLVVQDGVSFGLTALGNFDFYDVEAIESYRGPTGTLGGKGGSAGQVNVITKQPSFKASSDFSIAYGSWDTLVVRAASGGPIIDDLLAWRGAVIVDKGEGFYHNTFGYDTNNTQYNKNRAAGRIQLLLTPTEALSFKVSFDRQPKAPQFENGLTLRHDQPEYYEGRTFADYVAGNYTGVQPVLTDSSGATPRAKLYGYKTLVDTSNLVNPADPQSAKIKAEQWNAPRAWFANRPSPETPGRNFDYYADYVATDKNPNVHFNEQQGQYLSTGGWGGEINWLTDAYKLTSISAWRSFYFDAHNDEGTSFDISKHGGGSVDFSQYSQEFRITSTPGKAIDYTSGIYLYKSKTDVQSRTSWGSDAGAWFANTTQYNLLDRNAGVNRGAGLALLKDSLEDMFRKADIWVNTESQALFGQIDWHWSEAATFTAGLRFDHQDRTTEDAIILVNNGVGGALNPENINTFNLDGFATIANGNRGTNVYQTNPATGKLEQVLVDNNTLEQLQLADQVANRYYGAAINANTPGAAYNSLTKEQKAQVGAAKTLRNSTIGLLIPNTKNAYKDDLITSNLSQRYEFNDQITAYITWQHGEKAGTAFNINGRSAPVKAETTNAFEIGAKSFLFNNTLTLNADVFRLNIDNYQQAIRTVDNFATATAISNLDPNLTGDALEKAKNGATTYITSQGNVPEVVVQGLEIDGTYTGITNTTIRFSGAYNDARYGEYKNSPKPDELAYLPDPFLDKSDERLPGAALVTFNAGAEYRLPFNQAELHTSFNTSYTSDFNTGDTFSTYANVDAYFITDASLGIASKNGKYDVSLVVKNILDEHPHEIAWTTYTPYNQRRWFGLVFDSHF
ncbi:MAG TPA: TonB-dependent receptor [Cellvibrionaceae bacterium]